VPVSVNGTHGDELLNGCRCRHAEIQRFTCLPIFLERPGEILGVLLGRNQRPAGLSISSGQWILVARRLLFCTDIVAN
jgi:hypothetical protein